METIESWSARPAGPDMGAENRRITPAGPCPSAEFVALEDIAQPFPLHFHDFWTIGHMAGGRRMTRRSEVRDLGSEDFVSFGSGEVHVRSPLDDAPLHLIRVFFEEAGFAPHRCLQAVRANRARDLPAAGVDPTEAAARSGFADQEHLGRACKSFYGIIFGSCRTAARTRVREG